MKIRTLVGLMVIILIFYTWIKIHCTINFKISDMIDLFIPAILTTLFFQLILVSYPEHNRKKGLKKSILLSYNDMKANIVSTLLKYIDNPNADRDKIITDYNFAREIFRRELDDKTVWDDIINSIEKKDEEFIIQDCQVPILCTM